MEWRIRYVGFLFVAGLTAAGIIHLARWLAGLLGTG